MSIRNTKTRDLFIGGFIQSGGGGEQKFISMAKINIVAVIQLQKMRHEHIIKQH